MFKLNHSLLRSFAAVGGLFLAVATVSGCSTAGGSEGLNAERAQQLLNDGARIVDVRTPGEFGSGHLKNAVNIPVQVLQQNIAQLEPKDKPVVVYCRSGNRSGKAAAILKSAGFTNVINIRTMAGWPLR